MRFSKQGCENRAHLSFAEHRGVLEGEQSLRHPKARPKRWQPPAHPPSVRCSPKALTRQRPETLFPRGKAASPTRETAGLLRGSPRGPAGGSSPGLGRGPAQAGERQDTGRSRQGGGACARPSGCSVPRPPPPPTSPPPGTDPRHDGEERGGTHRLKRPLLGALPARCPGSLSPARAWRAPESPGGSTDLCAAGAGGHGTPEPAAGSAQ